MVPESIAEQIKLCNDSGLKLCYEACCEEYRRRLCNQWDFPIEESWWISDKIGGALYLADFWLNIVMEELRYMVDNDIPEADWLEYADYLETEFMAHDNPRINFWSWFSGLRPEMLKD